MDTVWYFSFISIIVLFPHLLVLTLFFPAYKILVFIMFAANRVSEYAMSAQFFSFALRFCFAAGFLNVRDFIKFQSRFIKNDLLHLIPLVLALIYLLPIRMNALLNHILSKTVGL